MKRSKSLSGRIAAMLMLLPLTLSAQTNDTDSLLLTVKAPSIAEINQKVHIIFVHKKEHNLSQPYWNLDGLKDVEILFGPSQSTRSTTSIVNGELKPTTTEISHSYIIQFDSVGTFTLPPFSMRKADKTLITTDSIRIEVYNESPDTSITNLPPFNPEDSILFADVTLDKQQVKLGDTVVCEVRLYYNKNLREAEFPVLDIDNAYWTEDSLLKRETEANTYNGRIYNSMPWSRFFIYPMQTGRLVIPSMEMEVMYVERPKFTDINDLFFGRIDYDYQRMKATLRTKELEIEVISDEKEEEPWAEYAFEALSEEKTLAIVTDRSSSLQATEDTIGTNYMQMERMFVEKLLSKKIDRKIEQTAFAQKAYHQASVGDTSFYQDDGSAIYNALLSAILRNEKAATRQKPTNKALNTLRQLGHHVTERKSYFSILLLTDGSDNGSYLSEGTITNLLLKYGIRVDVVAFASKRDSVFYSNGSTWIRSANKRRNMENLQRIAKATNGEFIQVEHTGQIPDAVKRIKNAIEADRRPTRGADKGFKPNPDILNRLLDKLWREYRQSLPIEERELLNASDDGWARQIP